MLRKAGHKVDYQSSKEKKWHKILKEPGDIVVAAGGDGTVGNVARRMIGSPTPIAVLPLGTANNIALTLGIAALSLNDVIVGWKVARCIHFDAGVAKGPWGSTHFIEGFGLGMFAETMFRIDSSNERDLTHAEHPEDELTVVIEMLRKRLRKIKTNELTVRLDGEDFSGRYVLLEALNIRSIGPNLNLAPDAEINDGLLDIVTVPHAKRAELSRYLAGRINSGEPSLKLRRYRGHHLQIEWESSPVHIDDMRWPDDDKPVAVKSNAITIKVEPGALVFLVPKAVPGQSSRRKNARARR
jgi:diacylglycerol kinase family enzyme